MKLKVAPCFGRALNNWAKASQKVVYELAVVVHASKEGSYFLFILGHGPLGEDGDLGVVEAEATGGDAVYQEVGGCGANFGFGRGKIEVVFPQAREKCSDVGGVGGRGGVEDDDVLEVRCHAFQTFDGLVDDFDESAGGGAAALRHDY